MNGDRILVFHQNTSPNKNSTKLLDAESFNNSRNFSILGKKREDLFLSSA